MKTHVFKKAGWILLFLLAAAPGELRAEIVLKDAVLIDGTGSNPLPGVSLHIRRGQIVRIGPAVEVPGAETVDLDGRWVLPGWIDSHSHLSTMDGAERALQSGVTTMRVLGTSHRRGIGLRDLIRNGHIEGPELQVAGGIIRPDLGTPFILTLPQFGRYLKEPLKGAEQVAEVVAALLDEGVDVIKVSGSGRAGLASTDPREPELSEAEIAAAVELARAREVFVAAHAHGRKGASNAVEAGVRSVEHGTYLSEEALRSMKERGTFLVPTLAVMSSRADPPGLSAEAIAVKIRTYHMQSALHEVVRQAHRLGIPIAASTDGTYGEGDETADIRIPHDIEDLVVCGLTPGEAIRSATQTGARLLGVADRTGVLQEGLEADLLVFDRSPLEDLRVLHEPILVMNNGKIVVNRMY